MDEISYMGIGFAVVIFTLACVMAAKLSSKTAYH
jgi:ABC-type transport system involved in cytochrome c biogenesis permease subunit